MLGNKDNGSESSEVAYLLNRPLEVFEELDLLHSFLKDYCTHLVLSCMVCGLYEYQRLISNSCFPLWQGRVWDLEHWVSPLDPCVWFGEGPQIQARNGLFLLCGYNKPPISGQHSPMFHSCCSITHRLNAPPSPKPGDKIGCSQPSFKETFALVRITLISPGILKWHLCARMQVLSCISSLAVSY